MSLSTTCIEQQQKDGQILKKFVFYSLLCSSILHAGVLTLAMSGMWDLPQQQADDPIELIFVEEPETPPEPELQEIVQEPEPLLEPEPQEIVEEPEPLLEPEPQEIVEEPEPQEIVQEQEVVTPEEPVETAIAQPQEITPEIPTETALSQPIEPPQELEPIPEPEPIAEAPEPIPEPEPISEPEPLPEPVASEPIAQPNPSTGAFSPDSIAQVQTDSASTPESSASESFSSPIAANIDSAPPKPETTAEVTQPTLTQSSSDVSSSLSEQNSFDDVASNSASPDAAESSLSSPIASDRSTPTRPAAVGTQPSVTESNSNIGSSVGQQNSFEDVASNSSSPDSGSSQFGSPLSSDSTGDRSRPSVPGAVGTQPSATQSGSGIGDVLSSIGSSEDGSGSDSGNPGSGELAAVGSPLQNSGDSREKPSRPGNGSGNGSGSGSGSGGVSCVNCPQPSYPNLAREQGLEGNPRLRIDIDSEGNVIEVYLEQSSGHSILDEAAMAAVQGWKLEPKTGGRQGVVVTLKFQLR